MGVSRLLWIQSDGTLLLDARHPGYERARSELVHFAELHKRPGNLHTYRVTAVSLWNAAAKGWTSERAIGLLTEWAGDYPPAAMLSAIRGPMDRYGQTRLVTSDGQLLLTAESEALLAHLLLCREVADASVGAMGPTAVAIDPERRGAVKRALAACGWPALDEAGYRAGEALDVELRSVGSSGETIGLRDYQQEAVDRFLDDRSGAGGSGIVVLPCGAGKTWVGMAALARLKCAALILTPNAVSVTQWISELLRHTSLREADIGEYTGQAKNVRPVTVATYQILTHRRPGQTAYPHWKLFVNREWGLIVYDEVHLLPAPVFRMTADIQATRRLGLTATLVREDGREEDAFALIGPKRYEMPWKTMERQGWIAAASCTEIRVPLDERTTVRYREAAARQRHRIAGENPLKKQVVETLLQRHKGTPTLVIGQYLAQLSRLSEALGLPLITGQLPVGERKRLFDRFNDGEFDVLIVSKVANFAVDLPDAAVAIQISGSYGSRQEEAQRLGRILRPKSAPAAFYTVVSDGTDEIETARCRSRFLLEQGYRYEVKRFFAPEEAAVSGENGGAG